MTAYFTSRRQQDEALCATLKKLVSRVSGTNLARKYSIYPNCKDTITYQVIDPMIEEGIFRNEVFIELNVVTGIVTVRFKVLVDNQKALWAVRGIASSDGSYITFQFSNFTEETETGLTGLIDEYFRKGAAAVLSVISTVGTVGTLRRSLLS